MTKFVLETAAVYGDDFADEMMWSVVVYRACMKNFDERKKDLSPFVAESE